MSPAWFSTAIFTPLSIALVRWDFSTSTVSAIRALMPPSESLSSRLPRITRKAGEPSAFAIRMPSARCSSAQPQSCLNVLDDGQMLHEPNAMAMPRSAP